MLRVTIMFHILLFISVLLFNGGNQRDDADEVFVIDVLGQTERAMEQVHSYLMTIDTFQQMDFLSEATGIRSNYNQVVEFNADPFHVRQTVTEKLEKLDVFGATVYEAPVKHYRMSFDEKKGFSAEEPRRKTWMLYADEVAQDPLYSVEVQMKELQMLQLFHHYAESVTIDEFNGHYIIKLTNEWIQEEDLVDNLSSLVRNTDSSTDDLDLLEAYPDMGIQYFEATLFVNRDTFILEEGILSLYLYLDMIDQEILAKRVVEMKWSELNRSLQAQVPMEVIPHSRKAFQD
ncbi:DUF6612 family protein [Salisediminibacterium selenitireducens]|uniref:Uncharacterized protein n=1 Tax=Bacillus selenitireducens (strain ATCC 700615 / DSM 15326 / MLS10) TaxID=439292 RepID=D6XZN5_BACIE|nr:DUF6612 family protein [Salisediminibacterium selenitireducens]ADH98409.1 hypothetical protein Bsel_0886 [[Bacillus] selenitireducens MLS10]